MLSMMRPWPIDGDYIIAFHQWNAKAMAPAISNNARQAWMAYVNGRGLMLW